ncbi:Peptidyl-tRNA hydrolase ArfB [Anatilimnocola aggregata]|uniref:Peptidyl-tRNA hydrolase ArfB n=1 Tax=Anatilimnocola aggregata TaxID=2528021 RepID=A0A517YIM2_9BACT|nr:alternative ribosome rescue aminoacyl-tRNA hydrolase ArfB [Anatilimnocola aggregata]QDU30083.1 Peptidyl-tRNA hydrolase ArfB [Anatilimnocola aggregata]
MITVSARITIPESELRFTFSRSSGPGGQNVNKVSSKATMHWNAVESPSLPDDVKQRFLTTYKSKLTTLGEVVIVSQESRDQPKNIQICLDKLRGMILEILVPPKKRRPTKPTKGSKVRRLDAKKGRSQTKQNRRPIKGE